MDERRRPRRAAARGSPKHAARSTTRARWPRPSSACRSWFARPASRPSVAGRRAGRLPPARATTSPVAVRSSATAEDTAGTSFAGMHETFANVVGDDALLDRLVDCWASLYGERVIAYRASQGLTDEPAIAVVVQRMVGLGAGRRDVHRRPVDRRPRPDRDRGRLRAGRGRRRRAGRARHLRAWRRTARGSLSARVGHKTHKLVGGPGRHGRPRSSSTATRPTARVLDRRRGARARPRSGCRSRRHYGAPQDIEWAIGGRRDRTSCSRGRSRRSAPRRRRPERRRPPDDRPVAARAWPRRPASASGRGARAALTQGRATSSQPGEVLVAPMTNPDWVPDDAPGRRGRDRRRRHDLPRRDRHPRARRARASSAPARATTMLRDGELVTVDGGRGRGLRGRTCAATAGAAASAVGRRAGRPWPASSRWRPASTSTWPWPTTPRQVAALPVDGVGLLRAEFMVTDALGGVHPRELLARGGRDEFLDAHVGSRCCGSPGRSRRGRSCTGRSTSARTSSAGSRAASEFEPVEENPMIGYRGCYRYVREPDLFALELELLARVREETPNLHLMIPFVRTTVGARGLPRGDRRQPARTPARPAPLGDGRGAVGRLPHPRVRGDGHRRRVDRLERPDPADARRRPRLRDLRRAVRRVRRRRARRHRAGSSPPAARPASRRRCAARRRRTGPSSPSTSCASASTRSRSTPTPSTGPVPWWPPPSGGCCSMLLAGPDEEPVAWATIHKPASPASRSCTSPPRARRHPAGHGPEPPHCPSMGEPPAVPCDT